MKSTRRPLQSAFGFSIVEMIAVVAIIAILIGLLVPALSKVQKMAANLSQKAQFSSISMGLEAFREDMGDYPESASTDINGIQTTTGYQGAQKLAEAMIGLDGFGFHPASPWNGDLDPATSVYDHTDPANIAARKGPYLELDTANAVMISSIYSAFPGTDSFILADKFKTVKNTATGKKTGMPILYFKASSINTVHPTAATGFPSGGSPASYADFVYSYFDNRLIMITPSGAHPMGDNMTGAMLFYESIINPNFSNPARPRNNESFILLSAGADGSYGTSDDVYNFETE